MSSKYETNGKVNINMDHIFIKVLPIKLHWVIHNHETCHLMTKLSNDDLNNIINDLNKVVAILTTLKKEEFECPIHDDPDNENIYTTNECGVCHCFWDCKTGLKKCLEDDDYSDHHEDIKQALKNMEE